MTVTIAIRWTAADLDVAADGARRAKVLYAKSGAEEFRVNQIYTGPNTGQWIFHITFADMTAYAKATALVRASDEMKAILEENAKVGNVMEEREILVGLDI